MHTMLVLTYFWGPIPGLCRAQTGLAEPIQELLSLDAT